MNWRRAQAIRVGCPMCDQTEGPYGGEVMANLLRLGGGNPNEKQPLDTFLYLCYIEY
jgi:hypothetical protein